MVKFAPVNVLVLSHITATAGGAKLRRAPQPPQEHHDEHWSEDWHLLHDADEDPICSGNEEYCAEGTEFHEWVSENCPRTCEVWADETRDGDLRPDCYDYVGHCPDENEDGQWARTYCAKTCEKEMELRAQEPFMMWGHLYDNPAPLMTLAFAGLLAYVRKLQSTHKAHRE